MSEAKHTPGNWFAYGQMVFSDSGSRVADCTPNDHDEREMPDFEDEANARLIARAPDMDAALRKALTVAREQTDALSDIINAADNSQAYTPEELKTLFIGAYNKGYEFITEAEKALGGV